ncbi:AGC/AKT kinase gad8 [Rhizoctonia solani]|uniref:non-specific serine/threonine protein kinase n=1 Tax=Rhizoctonia solani TaxID=456999 RepID=A0A8H8NWF7_9AGAM|nr:AGC/AKT kinase gad8 [Rhizoctonia solani]QRW20800.1 AGC/AKT kinase gad8 [Rhizoctonia solani]
MSGWKLGKKKEPKDSRSATPIQSRPTTPGPKNGASQDVIMNPPPNLRHGVLAVRIYAGRGFNLPTGVDLPAAISRAMASAPPPQARGTRDSMQRKRMWWLPYVVVEFDKNEVLVDALGGELANPSWMYKAHFDVSRQSNLSLSAYLRTAPSSGSDNDMGNDILLGRLDVTPMLEGVQSVDSWFRATTGTGEFHMQVQFRPSKNEPLTIESFDLLKVIGKGSFGKVMQVRKHDTSRIYALKTIRKAHIASRPGEITHILAERTVLALVNNPFIVPLKFSFQNQEKLYLVMSFVNGGELFYHLQREGRFDINRSRFYAAELLLALEHLHGFDVVYRQVVPFFSLVATSRGSYSKHVNSDIPTMFTRLVVTHAYPFPSNSDLKPENILLDYTGHIALCDFGLCKLNMSEEKKTNTFCGTPEYISPELLQNQGYTKTVDWWTLGVLLYEMMPGGAVMGHAGRGEVGTSAGQKSNGTSSSCVRAKDGYIFPKGATISHARTHALTTWGLLRHFRAQAVELLAHEGRWKVMARHHVFILPDSGHVFTGLPPFYDENVNTMYQRILRDPLRFPDEMHPEAKSVITGLLQRDPNKRLGNNGAEDIKNHPFFRNYVDWHALSRKKIQPPFKPSVQSAADTSNFDAEFTSEVPLDSVVENSHLSETVQDQFKGFTYNPANEHLSESVGYGSAMG